MGAVAPSAQDEPGGQASHPARPADGWKVPAPQRVHTALSASAKLPASHCVGVAEPVGQANPSGQVSQALADARLVASPNEPLAHSSAAEAPSPHHAPRSHGRQAVAFRAGWKLPLSHGEHAALRLAFA